MIIEMLLGYTDRALTPLMDNLAEVRQIVGTIADRQAASASRLAQLEKDDRTWHDSLDTRLTSVQASNRKMEDVYPSLLSILAGVRECERQGRATQEHQTNITCLLQQDLQRTDRLLAGIYRVETRLTGLESVVGRAGVDSRDQFKRLSTTLLVGVGLIIVALLTMAGAGHKTGLILSAVAPLIGLSPPLVLPKAKEPKEVAKTPAQSDAGKPAEPAAGPETGNQKPLATADTKAGTQNGAAIIPVTLAETSPRLSKRCQPWTVGCASTKGQVRHSNQDFAHTFLVGSYRIGIIADGMGGCLLGGRASRLAVLHAARSIAFDLRETETQVDHTRTCRRAFEAAFRAIKAVAARRGFQTTEIMRTTLLVAIATDRQVTYGYAGDGAGVILRANSFDVFLSPHRAPDGSNYLTASLGPSRHGSPSFGTRDLQPGDLVLLATDGVSDFTSPDGMHTAVVQYARAYDGDLQAAAQAYVKALEAESDALGPICGDNLTLGLIGTGVPAAYEANLDSSPDSAASIITTA